jgi:hypothetical protein
MGLQSYILCPTLLGGAATPFFHSLLFEQFFCAHFFFVVMNTTKIVTKIARGDIEVTVFLGL